MLYINERALASKGMGNAYWIFRLSSVVFINTWVAFVIATCPSTDTSTVLDISGRYLILAESGITTPFAKREAEIISIVMSTGKFFISNCF
jgi:hypothetical protein